MIKKIIFIFLFITPLFLFSQGYRGKKFAVSYIPGYSFVIEEAIGVSKYFLLHNKLEFGYCVSKRMMLSVGVEVVKGNFSDHYWYDTFEFNDKLINLKAIHFLNRHASYSPIGSYWGYSFGYGSQNKERIVAVDIPNSIYQDKTYYIDDLERTSLYTMCGYFGYNYIFKEKILYGIGGQFGVNFDKSGLIQPLRYMAVVNLNIGYIF